ncbi:MAG: ZIP family metal transporter, partial [Thermoplasmata archaeon]
SAGALLGDAFIHLLPEAVEEGGFGLAVSMSILAGIIIFFVLEKLIYWRHCHILTTDEHIHTFTYMNLIGDGVHNFIDGMIVAGSYMTSISLGFITTFAVILHEVPQEIGDFSVLVYGGFSKSKALFYNIMAALGAVVGAVLMLIIGSQVSHLSGFLVPFTAGGFIYIAGTDLIPELKKEAKLGASAVQMTALVMGVMVMLLLGFME